MHKDYTLHNFFVGAALAAVASTLSVSLAAFLGVSDLNFFKSIGAIVFLSFCGGIGATLIKEKITL
jgi:hypothetical protein